jgi:hypothetical protein
MRIFKNHAPSKDVREYVPAIKSKIMKTKTNLYILNIALVLAGLGITVNVPAREVQSIQPNARLESQAKIDPLTFVEEGLGAGTAADVYLVSCVAECIQADVNDAGPFDDIRFKVNINGSSPGFVGTDSAISPTGGLSQVAEVCSGQNVNKTRRAFITFSEVNALGPEFYDTVIKCRKAGGGLINPNIVPILDQ